MTTKITRGELVGLFLTSLGSRPCTVRYRTNARLLKTGNNHKNVEKTVEMNGISGYDYGKALKKRTAQAGLNPADQTPHSRSWGERVGNSSVIEYNGRNYLDVMVNKVIESAYKDLDTGKSLSYDEVKDFLPHRDNSLVKVANISMEHIESVVLDGETYEVV